jgi:hypothetical protein
MLLVLDEVRGKTLRLLQDVSEEQARWAPPGLHNTILWHAGHAHCLMEHLVLETLGFPPQMPEGWFDMFSWASKPATVPAERWPKLAEVTGQLRSQHQRARAALAAATMEQLAGAFPNRQSHWHGRPLSFVVFHGLHDEAMHGGEVHLLRKLQGISPK